ncbi:MAG: arginine deiminase family protein [Saprospiraceae bacterium]|nr:arginine deiminase family protein [Saprospiraceae bacterium]
MRRPCRAMIHGLRTQDRGIPDYDLAVVQHDAYVAALRTAGMDVRILDADEEHPDSVFVEDIAICLPDCVVITNPGAPSRKGEVDDMRNVLVPYFNDVHHILPPGTMDAGDVLEIDDHFLIGLSERTNQEGADQLIQILNHFGLTGSTVDVSGCLHLKSGASWLGDDTVLLSEPFSHLPSFRDYEQIVVPVDESYAANAVRVNDQLLVAAGFPHTYERLKREGYQINLLEMSEFRKIDGGLSCLSLRF